MKAILEFDMTEPSEVREHFRHTKSLDITLALYAVSNLYYKYDEEEGVTADMVFEDIRAILDGHNIVFDEIIE